MFQNKLFAFDRPDPEFELLETESGEPGYFSGWREERPREDTPEEEISPSVRDNEQRIRREFRSEINPDFILRRFRLGGRIPAFAAFLNGMADSAQINDFILRDGMRADMTGVEENLAGYTVEHVFTINEAELSSSWSAAKTAVLEGRTAVFLEGETQAVLMDTRGFERRGVDTPQNENVIRGPQEAFNENIRTNITLIRRIIKCEDLVCEFRNAGGKNNVRVGVLYREGVANITLVEEVKRRLAKINTLEILSSGTLEQLTEEHPFCPLPQLLSTERPDRTAAYLMEGSVAVLLDGSPFANIMPTTLFTLLATSEDAYSRAPIGNILRVVRYLGLLISILMPGAFLALALYHQGLFSPEVLTTLIASRKMVFVPLGVELILLLLIFHLVREAGLRVPGGVGQAIGIIGGLIMGQAAVSANLVSTVVLILVALTGLGNFAIPDYSTQLAAAYFRLLFVAAGWVAGLLGITAALTLSVAYLADMKSYGVPFLAPLAPRTYSKRPVILRGRVGRHLRANDVANTRRSI